MPLLTQNDFWTPATSFWWFHLYSLCGATLCGRLIARFTSTVWQSLVKFHLLVSVCEAWQWSRKQNLHRVDKNGGAVWSRLCTKVHDILGRCRRPLVVFSVWTHLSDCLYRVSFRRYRPLKLPLSCEVVQKGWFLGPRFVGGEHTPDLGHAFLNRTHFRPCGRFWLSSV